MKNFGYWILLLIAVSAVAYSLLQPLVWRLLFPGEQVPSGSENLTILMAPIATILAIAFGAFGILAYNAVKERMESQVNKTVNTAAEELKKDLAVTAAQNAREAAKRVEETVTAQLKEVQAAGDEALTRLFIRASNDAWKNYEDLWRSHWTEKPCVHNNGEDDSEFIRLVNDAVVYTERAITHANNLPEEKKPRLLIAAQNCLAYHLATRKGVSDRDRARELADQLQSVNDYNVLETVVWVHLRFRDIHNIPVTSQHSDKDIQQLNTLLQDRKIPLTWRHSAWEKYKGVFKLDIPKPPD